MIDKLKELKSLINKIIDSYIAELEPQSEPPQLQPEPETEPKPEPKPEPQLQSINREEFDLLKELLKQPNWPYAVDPQLICDPNSESDKENRADGIVELLIEEPLKNKKFLDYGCGEGHITNKAANNAILAVGFDIKEQESWAKLHNEKAILTSNLDDVKNNKPYDIILLYDVIDHTLNLEEARNILLNCGDLLSDNGKIYLRTHPFCSRHGTHLYQKFNKAFLHLIFTEAELKELGYESEPNLKVLYPMATYDKLIKSANLQIVSSNVLREKVESFIINTPAIKRRIISHYHKEDFPTWQCEQEFIDYILKKK